MRSRIVFLVLTSFVLFSAFRPAEFLIAKSRVGKLALEMPGAEVYRLYPDMQRKVDLRLEGNLTPAIKIFASGHSDDPALIVMLSGPADQIESIVVYDSRFKDEAGIHVGSSFGQLRRAHRKLELSVGEGGYWVAVKDAGLSFLLRTDGSTEAVLDATNDLSKIPDSTLVKSIVVFAARR